MPTAKSLAPQELPCGCTRYRYDEKTGKRLGTGQVFVLKTGNYGCKCGKKWAMKIEWIELSQ